mmetsp:Transcript_34132/g.50304  ORF Transcript_34132/g.50304 Transcript_34132/m.50304 type:complete len:130 (-) Transcript_34132:126-515(-)
MSSLHARRPPRLEQGAHLRKTKRSAGITPKRGAGSLRRPPSASASTSTSGTEPEMGNSGGGGNSSSHSSKRKCCNLQRTIVCTFVAVVLMFLFMQIRGMFGLMLSNSDASHLRGVSIGKSEVDAAVTAP